jgi:hypothetical protein
LAKRRDIAADCFDDAGEIAAKDRRQGMTSVSGLARPVLEIERIDAACLDPDQHLPGSRRWPDVILNGSFGLSRRAARIVSISAIATARLPKLPQ